MVLGLLTKQVLVNQTEWDILESVQTIKTEINNQNPANFAMIPENSFFYDIGVTSEFNTYANTASNETKTNFNFSNLAIAFRIAEGLGAGIVMIPYSDVGYSLIGIQSNIEGTDETFESNVTGLGGLNDFKLNLGYEVFQGMRLGASASFLFGNIEEDESFQISNSAFQLKRNFKLPWDSPVEMGLQFDLLKKP